MRWRRLHACTMVVSIDLKHQIDEPERDEKGRGICGRYYHHKIIEAHVWLGSLPSRDEASYSSRHISDMDF